MYNYDHRDEFYQDDTKKQYLILVPSDVEGEDPIPISNDEIDDESFELFDSIMDSDSLNFQNCLSTYIQFTTRNMSVTMFDKPILVYEVVEDDTENPIPIGMFTVKSDRLSDDRRTREIVAYDQMFDVINSDATDWYNSLEFPISQKDFRDAFFTEYGIEQDTVALIQDDILYPRQLSDKDSIGGNTIVKCLAEVNGVFPHIGKDGLLHWISLDTGDITEVTLYPSDVTYPGDSTFPGLGYQGEYTEITKDQYKEDSVVWENFATLPADAIQIRDDSNQIAYQTGEAINPYIIINNFLCYNMSYGQLDVMAQRLLDKIKLIRYVPYKLTKLGDPCLEVGDRVFIHTQQSAKLATYVFSKHMTGIIDQFEDIEAKGTFELSKFDVSKASSTAAKLKNLDNRVGNIEKSGSGPLQILSVPSLPANPQLNILYLIQGEVTDRVNTGI